jgi:hypothetical protein
MAKPPKLCAFCEKPGSITKQHIWPEWIKKIIPGTASSHSVVTGEFLTFNPGPKYPQTHAAMRQGPAGSRKVRNVCGPCNGGWMGRLETLVKPTASALILNQFRIIEGDEKRYLATWLSLISMMVEFTNPATAAIEQRDRTFLMERLEPPPHFNIWISRYEGFESLACTHMASKSLSPPTMVVIHINAIHKARPCSSGIFARTP